MKLIKLTSITSSDPIWINPESIGHIYSNTEEKYGKKVSYTVVGTTCHNNGGFKVKETVDKVFDLLATAKPYEFKK